MIVITGGFGFIGKALSKELIKTKDVIIIDSLSTGKFEDITKYYICDVSDREKLNKLDLPKIDIIYHLAGESRIQPSFTNPISTYDSNVTGTINVLELARKHNAKFVYAGSSTAYYDIYCNPYALTKFVGGEFCKMYSKVFGISTAIARFFNVFGEGHLTDGPYATVIGIFEKQKLETDILTVTGTGEKRRDFTNVLDIVSGLIAMSEDRWNGEVFNLGTGCNHSINEVARMFNPKEIKYIPARAGEAETTLADISFTKEKLGWEPKHALEDYVEKFLNLHQLQ